MQSALRKVMMLMERRGRCTPALHPHTAVKRGEGRKRLSKPATAETDETAIGNSGVARMTQD
jgi:hypothetical protein